MQQYEIDGSNDDDSNRQEIYRNLGRFIEEELSEKQRLYLNAYFYKNLKTKQIAELYGVDKSTVSRTLTRAKKKIEKTFRYYF